MTKSNQDYRRQATFVGDIVAIVETAAKDERRSFANMAEVFIREAVDARKTKAEEVK